MRELIDLFLTFARIGSLTFGGGYAMLPILEREVVDKRGWATNEELMDYYAIGQCTPGIIAVNTATFIGNKRRGAAGGIAATLGIVFPSLVIISIIAAFLSNFADLEIVRNAFAGIRVCVFVLILNATVRISRSSIKDSFAVVVFLIVMAGSTLLDLSPVIFVIAAGIAGIIAKVFLQKNEEEAGR
ncbi:MAG: chromate transporter [Eubacterium sp.]|nr:chromate transporter [Eubacterium sp.]